MLTQSGLLMLQLPLLQKNMWFGGQVLALGGMEMWAVTSWLIPSVFSFCNSTSCLLSPPPPLRFADHLLISLMPFPWYLTATQDPPAPFLCCLPEALQTRPSLFRLRAHLLPVTALQWISKTHCVWSLPWWRWGQQKNAVFVPFYLFI